MIQSLKLQNFLSFDNDGVELELQPLNVIIGTNGSGKSNFLEAFDLLRNAPSDITRPIREGGGVYDWLYKGDKDTKNAVLNFVVNNSLNNTSFREIRYVIEFNAIGRQFEIVDEKIETKNPDIGKEVPYIFYNFYNGRPMINVQGDENRMRSLKREDIDMTQSILVQKRDEFHYPEITFLANEFSKIRIYREWSFGRYTSVRLPQSIDLPTNYLESDCGNLCLVLNQIRNNSSAKKRLLNELKVFYPNVEDYEITFVGGRVQIFFHEQGLVSPVPATRLSDGTLRYLCLLAILCHPNPSPLVCIEEPELGLHHDVLPNLAKLLQEASERSQLIVTTHSETLVDCFTENPEAVIVAEKADSGTQLNRLKKEELVVWLEDYSLGNLWTKGHIGGTRW